jgi:hypothetical protein
VRTELGELFRWFHEPQRLAGAVVEADGDAGEVGGGVDRPLRVRGQVPDGDLGEVVLTDALILEVAAVFKRRPVSGQRLAEFLVQVTVRASSAGTTVTACRTARPARRASRPAGRCSSIR